MRLFLVAMVTLLGGYMFLGRGFAHLVLGLVYPGEIVLGLGIIAVAVALLRGGVRIHVSKIVGLLVVFMALGLVRTVPYLARDGLDALRDAALWGYGAYALLLYVLVDRARVAVGARVYGWVVPIFAAWLPIAWFLFGYLGDRLPTSGDSGIPILFFKNQDMAVHAIGAIAFLILDTSAVAGVIQVVKRFLVALSLSWTVYVTGSLSRGALAAVMIGVIALIPLGRSSRNWGPLMAAALTVAVFVSVPIQVGLPGPIGPTTSPNPTSATATAAPSVAPTPAPGREVSPGQLFENIASVLFPSSDTGLEDTKQFRLKWWHKIVDYTIFGPYFWTGKGFGVNLAADDGFQPPTAPELRAPHNSHMTVLARMGVPGFTIWVLLQVAFLVSLVRSFVAHRRAGDVLLSATAAWILVYWAAMMVNSSFDPYLEGPQGGIWFWTLFGLGLVVSRLRARPLAA